ncbi:short-chain fatty acid transporter [candidate division LCP-89 bacterium B3_LCP]|uniref:Short-chain fatty acid transporter n=1 Tax=candidate division LCP-89 bacterium B3_LCP TaxID=2012998 RepID=A0A532V2R3_UNCL8|nr:MAG: short-chain fatty acid transporter [candidate division LCP-89 bacterium B3_LCP]
MIARIGEVASRISARFVPDPFIFALLLTLLTMILGVIFTPSSPFDMANHWMGGFWDLLTFGMQMVLILVTGGVLAQSPPVKRLITMMAGIPRDTKSAVLLVSLSAMMAALINWGLGLIVGALLARETAKSLKLRGIAHHYPLIGAAGYTGLLIWHGGLSGSAPLTVATSDHFLSDLTGVIPVSTTIFGHLNVILVIALLIAVPLFLRGMLPRKKDEWQEFTGEVVQAQPVADSPADKKTPAKKLEDSSTLTVVVCVLALGYLIFYFAREGLSGLNLNSMNLLFLFLGFLFFLRPVKYVKAVNQAVKGTSGIILQFPFYAGIMGMMRQSGLVEVFSNALVNISNSVTFPVFAFISAGLVNLFVPSGGGQWAVQGPILINAAQQLGVTSADTVISLAYGDQWTNMLQPFWALPLLGITGLKASQIIGYTAALMFLVLPLIVLGLILFT